MLRFHGVGSIPFLSVGPLSTRLHSALQLRRTFHQHAKHSVIQQPVLEVHGCGNREDIVELKLLIVNGLNAEASLVAPFSLISGCTLTAWHGQW